MKVAVKMLKWPQMEDQNLRSYLYHGYQNLTIHDLNLMICCTFIPKLENFILLNYVGFSVIVVYSLNASFIKYKVSFVIKMLTSTNI